MAFIDLTHTLIDQMKEYPGDPKTRLRKVYDEDCVLYELETGLHTGTHMDAPLHYIKKGFTIDLIDLNNFIGKAKVIHESEQVINPTGPLEEIVIINTNWHKNWGSDSYFVDYPYLSMEFTERLIENNVKGIAIDTCSVDKPDEDKIHRKLLKNNIWILENIANSGKLKGKCYKSYFIPLKIEAEASPVRAFVERI